MHSAPPWPPHLSTISFSFIRHAHHTCNGNAKTFQNLFRNDISSDCMDVMYGKTECSITHGPFMDSGKTFLMR